VEGVLPVVVLADAALRFGVPRMGPLALLALLAPLALPWPLLPLLPAVAELEFE
jgi:hypothetical protein